LSGGDREGTFDISRRKRSLLFCLANGKLPHQPIKKHGTDINSKPAVNGWIKGRQINLKGKNIRYTV
jgi:hypothetical protein